MNPSPPTYDDIAEVLDNLPFIVRETRRRKKMSLRAVARELDCSDITIARVESGKHDVTVSIARALLEWANN